MTYASEDDLLSIGKPAEEDLVLSTGLTLKVRGLTRGEHLWIGKGTEDAAEIEARMISRGLVEPRMSEAKVKQLQDSGSSKVISEISDKIRELSGFGEGADKSGVREV
jgi:hypothetical protein